MMTARDTAAWAAVVVVVVLALAAGGIGAFIVGDAAIGAVGLVIALGVLVVVAVLMVASGRRPDLLRGRRRRDS
jgi:hypothetical protein